MNIKAAIFDCDGTLVDSMPMWFDVFPSWLASHGIANARAICDEAEHMDFEEECIYLAQLFGRANSPNEALAEVKELVRKGYQTRVAPFAGVREFLDELAAAHIPMAILSSTSAPLVREVLATYQLDGYFQSINYTGDVGYDKQHPEAYTRVCAQLGTPVEQTWVFEDAPFAVACARKAGFPVACLLNDHDGRDESFLAEHADIVAHSWAELSLARLADYERPHKPLPDANPLQVLIVGGSPEASSAKLIAKLASEADYVIAADRGAEILKAAGVSPDVFCGDSDSVSAKTALWAREAAARHIAFPPEKYALDLTIAIECARHEAARTSRPLALTVSCVSGGRPDHALGVLGCLLANLDCAPRIVEDAPQAYECRLLSPAGVQTWELGPHAVGHTFSCAALAEAATLSETGMQWNLDHATFSLLADQGYSNRVVAPNARISCHSGVLACYLLA